MKRQTHTQMGTILDHTYAQVELYAIKPLGLWYSIGDEWGNWCKENLECKMIKTKVFELDIEMKDVLVIKTFEDVETFNNKYTKPNTNKHLKFIDWDKVSQDYRGIEIPNYGDVYRNSYPSDPLWLYAWDVSSGCLFTTDIIKEFKEIKNEES